MKRQSIPADLPPMRRRKREGTRTAPKDPTIGKRVIRIMPISKADFDRGRTEDTDEEKVVQLLHTNRGQAYNASEIAEAIGHGIEDPIRQQSFLTFLDQLVGRGIIEKKLVEVGSTKDWYYSSKA
jgi:hypothetical protein